MRKSAYLLATITTLLSGPLVSPSSGITDDEAATGRSLMDLRAAVVVNVELVASIKLPSRDREVQPREQKIEINGTVVSPSGLTVISLSAADPRPVIAPMGLAAPTSDSPNATIKSIKLRFPDGAEFLGEIVGKDADTGLAFVAPIEKDKAAPHAFDFLELENASEGAILQNCILLGRTNPAHQALPLVRVTYIMGKFETPVLSYILPEQHTGVPAFTSAGKVLGIATVYLVNHRQVATVIIPASEVTRAIKRSSQLVK